MTRVVGTGQPGATRWSVEAVVAQVRVVSQDAGSMDALSVSDNDALTFTAVEWAAFLDGARAGEFDR